MSNEYGITPVGWVGKSASDLKSEIETDLMSGPLGKGAGTEPDGSIPVDTNAGQLVALLVDFLTEVWQLGQAIVACFDPAQASGMLQDLLYALIGILRNPVAYTLAKVACVGTPGAPIYTNPTTAVLIRVSPSGAQFQAQIDSLALNGQQVAILATMTSTDLSAAITALAIPGLNIGFGAGFLNLWTDPGTVVTISGAAQTLKTLGLTAGTVGASIDTPTTTSIGPWAFVTGIIGTATVYNGGDTQAVGDQRAVQDQTGTWRVYECTASSGANGSSLAGDWLTLNGLFVALGSGALSQSSLQHAITLLAIPNLTAGISGATVTLSMSSGTVLIGGNATTLTKLGLTAGATSSTATNNGPWTVNPSPRLGSGIVDGGATWVLLGVGQGVTNVPFQSVLPGPIPAAAGSLTTIMTPVIGWSAVYNVNNGTLGRAREGDNAYRLRREAEIHTENGGPPDAIRASILRVGQGTTNPVTSCTVLENKEDASVTKNGNTLPPHSVMVLADYDGATNPALEQSISDAVWAAVGGGIATSFGSAGDWLTLNGILVVLDPNASYTAADLAAAVTAANTGVTPTIVGSAVELDAAAPFAVDGNAPTLAKLGLIAGSYTTTSTNAGPWTTIGTGSAITGSTTDSEGNPQTVYWARPTQVPIYVSADVTFDTTPNAFPASEGGNGTTPVSNAPAPLIKDAVCTTGNELPSGKSVRASLLSGAIFDGLTTATGQPVPGILDVTSIAVGTAPGPSSSSVTITQIQRAVFSAANVVINLVGEAP